MNELTIVPRKIYYIKATGEFVLDTGQSSGVNIRQTTMEEDFELYVELKKYNTEMIGCLVLEVNQYMEDFLSCASFRVNPETEELEFVYMEDIPNKEPQFSKPLIELIDDIKNLRNLDDQRIADLELILAEIITL